MLRTTKLLWPMAAPIQTARSNVRVTQAICSLKTDIRANVEVYSRKLAAVSQLLAGQFHTHSKTLRCEWIVDLTNPEATIQFTIDESAYGINGRSPCPTDYVMFFDGMSEDSSMMNKLCKYDLPDTPIITSTSQGKVMFSGTKKL